MGFDDPDKPTRSSGSSRPAAARRSTIPAKIKCCGFPIIQAREDTALAELIQPIEQAKEAGADAIVTPCPLCHLSLDAWQSKLKKQTGKDFQMPILHLSQLVGVAAGPDRLGAEVQAPRRLGRPGLEKLSRLKPRWWHRPCARERTRSPLVTHGLLRSAASLALRRAGPASPTAWFEAGWLRTRVLEVEIDGLPEALDGLRIAPPLRLPPRVPVARPASRPSAPSPGSPSGGPTSSASPATSSRIRAASRCSCGCSARSSGPFVVLGNHDVAVTRDPFSRAAELDDLDEVARAAPRRGRRRRACAGGAIQIVGVDAESYPRGTARPWELADPTADLRILLCHFPGIVRRLPAGAFDLILAGHLHAGQIVHPVPGRADHARAPAARGSSRGSTRAAGGVMHVSPGTGTTFVPFRFFARPEVTELVLRPAPAPRLQQSA